MKSFLLLFLDSMQPSTEQDIGFHLWHDAEQTHSRSFHAIKCLQNANNSLDWSGINFLHNYKDLSMSSDILPSGGGNKYWDKFHFGLIKDKEHPYMGNSKVKSLIWTISYKLKGLIG